MTRVSRTLATRVFALRRVAAIEAGSNRVGGGEAFGLAQKFAHAPDLVVGIAGPFRLLGCFFDDFKIEFFGFRLGCLGPKFGDLVFRPQPADNPTLFFLGAFMVQGDEAA